MVLRTACPLPIVTLSTGGDHVGVSVASLPPCRKVFDHMIRSINLPKAIEAAAILSPQDSLAI